MHDPAAEFVANKREDAMASAQSELKAFVDGQLEVRACDDDSRVLPARRMCALFARCRPLCISMDHRCLSTHHAIGISTKSAARSTLAQEVQRFSVLLARSAACASSGMEHSFLLHVSRNPV
jgi:hypothetical protein